MTAKATLHGNITDTGGENCGERGFDYDYDSGAPYANSWTETNSYGTGAFSHEITGLNEGVTVYFRAKAHNSAGWGYGSEKSFVTPKAWSKALSENLGLLDKTVKKDVSIMKAEPLGLLDTYGRTWAIYRVYPEILGLSDTVVATRLLTKILTELLGLSDTVKKDTTKVLAENLGLLDVYSRAWSIYRTYDELLGLADSIVKDIVLHPLVEPLGLVDSVVKSTAITRDELLGLKDSIAKDTAVTRSELLGLADTLAKGVALPLSEILGLLDTYTRVWSIQRTYTETLGLEDRVSKHVSLHALTEVLGLLDSISYSKNPTILAKLIRKYLQLVDLGGGSEE